MPPAAVDEDAEGLSSADVELAGIPRSVVCEGSVAVGEKIPAEGEAPRRTLEVGLLAGLHGGMVAYTRWRSINNSPGSVDTVPGTQGRSYHEQREQSRHHILMCAWY